MLREPAKDRVFTSGDSVLARNYRGESKWVPATVIAQTGPVSYTVHTADNVWRRHADQLLQTPTVPGEMSLGDPSTVLVKTPVHVPTPLQHQASSETQVPVADVPAQGTETPTIASAPATLSPVKDNQSDVSVDRRYPVMERQPLVRLNL